MMAEAQLNFNPETIDKDSSLYLLYSLLYDGAVQANSVDAPSFLENPPLKDNGEVDEDAIAQKLADYSDIQMKNAAYLYANSIISVIGTGGGASGGGNYISRSGDSMSGALYALRGFSAGKNGKAALTIVDGVDNNMYVDIGSLKVANDTAIGGRFSLADSGIYFGESQTIWIDGDMLRIVHDYVGIAGNIIVDGSIRVGNTLISQSGITWDGYDFYHKGNSNNAETNWSMLNAYVYGDLALNGNMSVKKRISVSDGFDFSYHGKKLIYTDCSEDVEDGVITHSPFVVLSSDLHIQSGHGLKIGNAYLVQITNNDKAVSFSAPGRILNLGDSDGDKLTSYIALQSNIKNYTGSYDIVSRDGAGNFPNGFSAGASNATSTVLRTYFIDKDNQGVVLGRKLRLGDLSGPSLYSGDGNTLSGTIPYATVTSNGLTSTSPLSFSLAFSDTTSPFRNTSINNSATLHFTTDGEFFSFDKPIESEAFMIKTQDTKTCLITNNLFLNNEIYLRGLSDGIQYAGNAYFEKSLSSFYFSSGFAGKGFGIINSPEGYAATFDTLTIRKKFRVYELEVQKITATNGSLWVSDNCSGDYVVEVD